MTVEEDKLDEEQLKIRNLVATIKSDIEEGYLSFAGEVAEELGKLASTHLKDLEEMTDVATGLGSRLQEVKRENERLNRAYDELDAAARKEITGADEREEKLLSELADYKESFNEGLDFAEGVTRASLGLSLSSSQEESSVIRSVRDLFQGRQKFIEQLASKLFVPLDLPVIKSGEKTAEEVILLHLDELIDERNEYKQDAYEWLEEACLLREKYEGDEWGVCKELLRKAKEVGDGQNPT